MRMQNKNNYRTDIQSNEWGKGSSWALLYTLVKEQSDVESDR